MKNKFALIIFSFFASVTMGQPLFVDKVWFGSQFTIKQSESKLDGFALYYFNKNGVLETLDTSHYYNWKYSKRNNVIKIYNNKKSFNFKIVKNSKDSLILSLKKNKYIFTLIEDSTSCYACDLIDTLLINRSFVNVNNYNKIMILNENNSINFVEENISYDLLNDKKWKLFHFRNFYFILIYPDIIVFQLIKYNKDFLLISIDKQKSSNFLTVSYE